MIVELDFAPGKPSRTERAQQLVVRDATGKIVLLALEVGGVALAATAADPDFHELLSLSSIEE